MNVHLELLEKRFAFFLLFRSQVIAVQKCYLIQNFEKEKHFTPFSVAYYFLIDFSKILQFTFPCCQLSLMTILRK